MPPITTWRRAVAYCLSVVVTVAGVSVMGSPAAVGLEPAGGRSPELVLVAPASGATIDVSELPRLGEGRLSDLPPGVASASLLGPVDALNCNTLKRAGHVVTTYQAKKKPGFSGGRIKLECGVDQSSGYRHIRYRHQNDWTRKMAPMRGNWDDFMDFATRQSLAAPSNFVDQGGGRLCYTTLIQVRDRPGKVIKSFYPRIAISKNNRRVITSIPGGGC